MFFLLYLPNNMSSTNNNNNNITTTVMNDIEHLFSIHYQKRKNIDLFENLEKIANVSKLQNYIPIYSHFFSLNLQNYNNINLNNKWYISDVYSIYNSDSDTESGSDSGCGSGSETNTCIKKDTKNNDHDNDDDDDDDDDSSDELTTYINQCLYDCKLNNILNKKSKDKTVFIKFAPLLDPIKFLTGKYDNTNDIEKTYLYNLPSIEMKDNINVHPKLLTINNTAYVDNFFVYLSSMLLHNTNFLHGLDYYGSFLGIKTNFTINVYDDLDYLSQSDYFNKNKNILFEVDDENYDYDHENNTMYSSKNLKKIVINNNNENVDINIDTIDDTIQLFDDIFVDNNSNSNSDNSMTDVLIDELLIENININNQLDKINTSLKSSSSCSSRTSYTSESSGESKSSKNSTPIDNNNDCGTCNLSNDEIPDLVELDKLLEESLNNEEQHESNEGGHTFNLSDSHENNSSSSYDSESEYIEARIPKFPVELICMEYCENTFDNLIANNNLSDEEWFSALLQIIMMLLTYQKTFSFTHNDLHTNNVMYNLTDKKYIYYCYKNKYYKVPTFGRLFKIIDFGRGIYKYKGNLFCSDSFQVGGDAATQYNTEPYFNDKKPRIDPNYSFDLCRLACSIFDYLVDDITNLKELERNSLVTKLIVEWCLDDKGINLLYKANGDDRYPEFKLYKMIARCCHNHTPENQLSRPEFSKFVVPYNSISKTKNIIDTLINIDKMPNLTK